VAGSALLLSGSGVAAVEIAAAAADQAEGQPPPLLASKRPPPPVAGGDPAGNQPAATNPVSLRLVLGLVDGSRLIGVPQIASLPVQTAYAKLDVSLSNIVSVSIGTNREQALWKLSNGDQIKGALALKTLEIKAEYGKVAIGVEQIVKIETSRQAVIGGNSFPDCIVGVWGFYQNDANGSWLFDVEVVKNGDDYEFRALPDYNHNFYKSMTVGRLLTKAKYDEAEKVFRGDHYVIENGNYYGKIVLKVLNRNYLTLEDSNPAGVAQDQSLRRPPAWKAASPPPSGAFPFENKCNAALRLASITRTGQSARARLGWGLECAQQRQLNG
jgi:hypothetical protein